MQIRTYATPDEQAVITLMQTTIRTINAADYSPQQITTWATIDPATFRQAIAQTRVIVMVAADTIVGFANMTASGYLDHVFVHHDFQRQHLALQLVTALEQASPSTTFTTAASITAKPFFERLGYHVEKEQLVKKNDVTFLNYRMRK
jgi:putative acetyltransferase